jgi:hypothetical protein
MHYSNLTAAATFADRALLREDENASCVKGCYRCLLSYYNQPDHEQIDRTNDLVKTLLLRLARSRVMAAAPRATAAVPNDWHAAIIRWGLPAPDGEPLNVNGTALPIVWRAHLAAATLGEVDAKTLRDAEMLGFTIVVLPESPGQQPPPALVNLLGAAT